MFTQVFYFTMRIFSYGNKKEKIGESFMQKSRMTQRKLEKGGRNQSVLCIRHVL